MAALLAVVAFVVALVFQLAGVAFGDFNYVSVALIGLTLLALHSTAVLGAVRLNKGG